MSNNRRIDTIKSMPSQPDSGEAEEDYIGGPNEALSTGYQKAFTLIDDPTPRSLSETKEAELNQVK